CRDIVREVDSAHSGPATALESSGDGTGYWDPDRLSQVVTNLVSNAVAHSPPGKPVVVRVGNTADGVVLEVTNTGAAIPAHVLPTLFDPFKRAGAGDGRE